MQKAHENQNWRNFPSIDTPLNETNLNQLDRSVDVIDDRVIALDVSKMDLSQAQKLIKEVEVNSNTGVITKTYYDGSKQEIQTSIAKIPDEITFNPETQQLVIVHKDGTEEPVDLSAVILQSEFIDSDTISAEIQSNGKVKFKVKDGSIQGKHLQPNYLADITVQAQSASQSATNAQQSAQSASQSATNAQQSAQQAEGSLSGVTSALNYLSNATVKNMLKITAESQTINGVKFDVDKEKGTITANGTATANIRFFVTNNINLSGLKKLTGCPTGGSTNSYCLQIIDSATLTYGDNDTGNGVTKDLREDVYKIGIVLSSGTVCNNLVFRPMLRPASITDGTFIPHREVMFRDSADIKQKSGSFVHLEDSVEGHAMVDVPRNVLEISVDICKKMQPSSGTWSGNTLTYLGVSYTINDDGTISVSGTKNGSYSSILLVSDKILYSGKKYACHVDLSQAKGKINFYYVDGNNEIYDHISGGDFILESDNDIKRLAIYVGRNVTVPNTTVKISIEEIPNGADESEYPHGFIPYPGCEIKSVGRNVIGNYRQGNTDGLELETRCCSTDVFSIKKGDKITISSSNSDYVVGAVVASSKNDIITNSEELQYDGWKPMPYIFNSNFDGYFRINVRRQNATNITVDEIKTKVMVEFGEIVHPYEPYREKITHITPQSEKPVMIPCYDGVTNIFTEYGTILDVSYPTNAPAKQLTERVALNTEHSDNSPQFETKTGEMVTVEGKAGSAMLVDYPENLIDVNSMDDIEIYTGNNSARLISFIEPNHIKMGEYSVEYPYWFIKNKFIGGKYNLSFTTTSNTKRIALKVYDSAGNIFSGSIDGFTFNGYYNGHYCDTEKNNIVLDIPENLHFSIGVVATESNAELSNICLVRGTKSRGFVPHGSWDVKSVGKNLWNYSLMQLSNDKKYIITNTNDRFLIKISGKYSITVKKDSGIFGFFSINRNGNIIDVNMDEESTIFTHTIDLNIGDVVWFGFRKSDSTSGITKNNVQYIQLEISNIATEYEEYKEKITCINKNSEKPIMIPLFDGTTNIMGKYCNPELTMSMPVNDTARTVISAITKEDDVIDITNRGTSLFEAMGAESASSINGIKDGRYLIRSGTNLINVYNARYGLPTELSGGLEMPYVVEVKHDYHAEYTKNGASVEETKVLFTLYTSLNKYDGYYFEKSESGNGSAGLEIQPVGKTWHKTYCNDGTQPEGKKIIQTPRLNGAGEPVLDENDEPVFDKKFYDAAYDLMELPSANFNAVITPGKYNVPTGTISNSTKDTNSVGELEVLVKKSSNNALIMQKFYEYNSSFTRIALRKGVSSNGLRTITWDAWKKITLT